VHFRIRVEEDRLCTLVVLGVRRDGTKELLADEDGYRESSESGSAVVRDLERRGMRAPVLAIGDGALGFWKAVRDVWPARAALLDPSPGQRARQAARSFAGKSRAGAARDHERARARAGEESIEHFAAEYGATYPKAVAALQDDQERLLAFYDFPGGTLAVHSLDERDRVVVRQGLPDGLQAARHGLEALAHDSRRTARREARGWGAFVDGIEQKGDRKSAA
jgi:transposase-like protein